MSACRDIPASRRRQNWLPTADGDLMRIVHLDIFHQVKPPNRDALKTPTSSVLRPVDALPPAEILRYLTYLRPQLVILLAPFVGPLPVACA